MFFNFTKIAEYGVLAWLSAVKFEAKFTDLTSNLGAKKVKEKYREMDFYFAMIVTLKRERALFSLRS
ncbi:MAG: hypothetical protein D8H92_06805 [Campylobacter sp.]|nr:MAG: hypothetical protein D8H92_06805 [Campylobacter sp.]